MYTFETLYFLIFDKGNWSKNNYNKASGKNANDEQSGLKMYFDINSKVNNLVNHTF